MRSARAPSLTRRHLANSASVPFELDRQSGELFKLGHKLNLHGQPIEVLSILLERPSEVVTREELCKRLWPEDTFVDFAHSLNTAIKRLRQTLDDDPDAPRYIETLPKKGYRLIAQVELATSDAAIQPATDSPLQDGQGAVSAMQKHWRLVAAIVLLLLIAAGSIYRMARHRKPVVTGIHELTRTGRGKTSAYMIHQVATDGARVYFSDDYTMTEISTKGGEVSHLKLPALHGPQLLGSAADGSELLLVDEWASVDGGPAWLARLPSGPQRRIGKVDVAFAALLPDGKSLLYTRGSELTRMYLQTSDASEPHVAFETPKQIGLFSIAPDGKKVRFEMADQLWQASLDGSGMHRLSQDIKDPLCCGSWSADGRTYIFARKQQGVFNLWAVDESAGPARSRVSTPIR